MAVREILLCSSLLIVSACASAPQESAADMQAHAVHQDPLHPNPQALPEGVLEWVNYVCNDIPDPEARKQAIRDGAEQKGWIFTCPDDQSGSTVAAEATGSSGSPGSVRSSASAK